MTRDPAFTSIETERLVLRRFERGDVEAFAAYRGDPDVARYQSWQDYTHAEAEAFVEEMLGTDPGVPGEWFQFAIAERTNGRLLGDCALVLDAGDPPTAEIGYTLDPGARGRGFATEAVGALIDYAFDRSGRREDPAVTRHPERAVDRGGGAAGDAADRHGAHDLQGFGVRRTHLRTPEGRSGVGGATCACAPPRA